MGCVRHTECMGEKRNAYRIMIGKCDVKRPLGRCGCKWKDNIKMDLKEMGYQDADWINFAHNPDQ
jgi:hypothetical protein